jgi:hypothetical protein
MAWLDPSRLPLEYRHADVQTAVVPHISVGKAQRLLQVVDGDTVCVLTSVDLRGAEPPAIGGTVR